MMKLPFCPFQFQIVRSHQFALTFDRYRDLSGLKIFDSLIDLWVYLDLLSPSSEL